MKKETIRNMLLENRPYVRCLSRGIAVLSDAELLAFILRTGVKGSSSLRLAEVIL